MPVQRIEIDTKLWMSDRLFEVLNVTPEGTVFLRALDNREVLQRKRDDIALDIGAGVARLRLPAPRTALKTISMPTIEEKLRTDISLLGPVERKAFERRWAYIQAITAAKLVELERERTLTIVKEVATHNADRRPPSYATISRWHRAYVAGGRDMRALFPSTRRRGRRIRRLPPEVLKIAREVIYENYLTREQLSGRRTYDALISAIDDQNKRSGRASQLPFPSLRWVFNEIRRVADPYEIKVRREGKAAADQHFRAVYQGPRPCRPLERVEIDHTVLDVMIVDDEYGTAIGRPTLTIAVDVATRMIVGLHLGFAAPSAHIVLRCLRNIIFPKHEIISRYPSIKNSWDAYGVPETIVVDNGGELHAATVEEACRRLNIRMQHAPRKTPRYKGTVERLFGIINTDLLTGLPGRTFHSIKARGDYNPKNEALISFSALLEMLHKWVVDDYHQNPRSGTLAAPAEAWKQGVVHFDPPLPSSAEDVDFALSHIAERSLRRTGIQIFGLYYNSDEANVVLLRCGGSTRVTVRYNADDISSISIIDPASGEPIYIPCLDQEYTQGLTAHQHRVIRRFKQNVIDRIARDRTLAETRRFIRFIILSERAKKRRGYKKDEAWYASISSDVPAGLLELASEPGALDSIAASYQTIVAEEKPKIGDYDDLIDVDPSDDDD